MRSQVTRHVLRCPPVARGLATSTLCLGSPAPRPTFRTYPVGCRVARTIQPRAIQRRSFFKLFQKAPRTLKEIEAEPGYVTLLSYRAAYNSGYRPPPVSELVKAWQDFFNYKAKHNRVVNSTQAMVAQGVLVYFLQPNIAGEVPLTVDDLHRAMRCLERPPRDDPAHHMALSSDLFKEIRRRVLDEPSGGSQNAATDSRLKIGEGQSKYLHSYLVALSQYGRAMEAKDMFLANLPDSKQLIATEFQPRHSLLPVINGLAKEGQELALHDVVIEALKSGIPYDVSIHSAMTSYFAQRDNFEATKIWWNKPIRKGLHPAPVAYYDILQFALRTNQQEWAMEVYEDLIVHLESGEWSESKACWDVSYQFAFLLLGKSIDHIEHMFKVALERNADKPKIQPNIGTINSLLKCAVDKDDPYAAERIISLSKTMGFEPDLSTYILQLEYRLHAKDEGGAYATFLALRNLETSSSVREVAVLNKLIRTLCESSRPDYEKILEVTNYLEQRHVTLEPETVASICMAFMNNDETYEVIDTLSLHTAHYSIDERRMVRKSFVGYCLDRKNSTQRVWDAYALLRQFFPEVENEDRVTIMDAFFDRRRADMACHVFGHMRAHDNLRHRPTLETYVRCLEGLGRCPDEESLRIIHNMAKMDATIQMNTTMYNALMIGYIASDAPYRALEFWKEVTNSPEGPSYASLEIAFRAYQIQSEGDAPARELWAKMTMMDVDVPEHVYAAYLTALAAHDHLPDVKALLEDSESIIGKRPDFLTLAYIYNALPSKETQEDLEAWSQHEYPTLWKALTKKHRRRQNRDGVLQFKVSRPWKA
ncbi:putative pentatricopeptide repeat domain-containing protein [Rosellinia necatrix]|uniref:Putative pentatricopeptide repeat domain-containing protein n=1 Tax=Rosellinia necatrix TaxID=77044 RepID=A0A1S7UIZ2_ROSNE|nr:putative pentatricopeptide repeat domain-containing protein [Rosellinia necatrix]